MNKFTIFLLANVAAFVLFNLFVGYLFWDLYWFTNLGEYEIENRLWTGYALFVTHLVTSAIAAFTVKK